MFQLLFHVNVVIAALLLLVACSSDSNSNSSKLDESPPSTSASPPGGAYNTEITVELNCIDDNSGCDPSSIRYSEDENKTEEEFKPYNSAAKITLTADTSLRFYSKDYDGRVEPTKTVNYEFDFAPELETGKKDLDFSIKDSVITISWHQATDAKTNPENLEYQLYYATQNVIGTKEGVIKNGRIFAPWQKATSATVNLKTEADAKSYFWNVLVRDEYPNSTAYISATFSDNTTIPDVRIEYPLTDKLILANQLDASLGSFKAYITLNSLPDQTLTIENNQAVIDLADVIAKAYNINIRFEFETVKNAPLTLAHDTAHINLSNGMSTVLFSNTTLSENYDQDKDSATNIDEILKTAGTDTGDNFNPFGLNWTWTGGATVANSTGIYGSIDDVCPPAPTACDHIPGARSFGQSWVDSSGEFWLFGGLGIAVTGSNYEYLNDLWRWDGSKWHWISGHSGDSNILGDPFLPNYGSKGIPHPNNIPGGRYGAVSWIDSNGHFWLFGGQGYTYNIGPNGTGGIIWGYLNDLWRWDGSNWTWIAGSDFADDKSMLADIPSPREGANGWVNADGDFWLFGGSGYSFSNPDPNQVPGFLNDLWRGHWDPTLETFTWTRVSIGVDPINQIGIYEPNPSNMPLSPGSRWYATHWTDSNNDFWLFGGYGIDGVNTTNGGELNDLWRGHWEPGITSTDPGVFIWTWVSGSKKRDLQSFHGSVPGDITDIYFPGGRDSATAWVDSKGMVWLFGGYGLSSGSSVYANLNDLWRWDGSNWTWMGGSKTSLAVSNYGTKNITAPNNNPGARAATAAWIDQNDTLWFFGGSINYGSDIFDNFNDFWSFGRNEFHSIPAP